jgi:hypothetical protein
VGLVIGGYYVMNELPHWSPAIKSEVQLLYVRVVLIVKEFYTGQL